MSELGPLEQLLGNWEGNVGLDVSYDHNKEVTGETGYFEKASFSRIPDVHNGTQTMYGVTYQMTAWRHGEEDSDPFHDEVGYMLWDADNGQVMRCFAVPRAIAILAGGSAGPDDKVLDFKAEPGDESYGLVQNKYLVAQARTKSYEATFTFGDDGSLTYTSDLLIDLSAIGGEMHHTDTNTLHRA